MSIKTNKHIVLKNPLYDICESYAYTPAHAAVPEHMYIYFCIYIHTYTQTHAHSLYIHYIVNMAHADVSVDVSGTNISTLVGIIRIHAKYGWNYMYKQSEYWETYKSVSKTFWAATLSEIMRFKLSER